MKNIFYFKRFTQLLRIHLKTNYKQSFIFILVCIFLSMTYSIMLQLVDISLNEVVVFHAENHLGWVQLMGTFYAAKVYSHYRKKSSAINYIVIPASTFEKFIMGVLFPLIMFPLFCIVVACMSLLSFHLVALQMPDMNSLNTTISELFSWNNWERYFIVAPFFIFGASIFKSYTWLKTIASVLLLLLLSTIVTSLLLALSDTSRLNYSEASFEIKYLYFTFVLLIPTYFFIRKKQA